MEIHDLFSLDIFFQGVFILFSLIVGLFLVFKDNLEGFNDIKTISEFSHDLQNFFGDIFDFITFKPKQPASSKNNLFVVIPLIIIFSFIVGILGNSLADKWIDSANKNHLWLKPLWGGKMASNITKSNKKINKQNIKEQSEVPYRDYLFKNSIRTNSFQQVFNLNVDKDNSREVMQLYYQAKHEIIKDKNYYSYVRKSQAISEYSRAFALGFFFIFICSLINLIIMSIRVPFRKFSSNNDDIASIRRNILKRIVSISNGVIFIFALLSIGSILFFIDPNFRNVSNYPIFYQGLVFSFIYFGCFTFFAFIFPKFEKLRFSFFVYSVIYVLSVIGYITSAKIWISSEKQVSKKVYGIYKSMHLSEEVPEIKFARDELCLIPLNNKRKNKDSIK